MKLRSYAFAAGCAVAAVALTSCSGVHDDLQSQTWSVVSTNGEAYDANFNERTVSYSWPSGSRGFSYSIDDNVITMEEQDRDDGPIHFDIDQEGDDYVFTPQTQEVADQYGTMTLSPTED